MLSTRRCTRDGTRRCTPCCSAAVASSPTRVRPPRPGHCGAGGGPSAAAPVLAGEEGGHMYRMPHVLTGTSLGGLGAALLTATGPEQLPTGHDRLVTVGIGTAPAVKLFGACCQRPVLMNDQGTRARRRSPPEPPATTQIRTLVPRCHDCGIGTVSGELNHVTDSRPPR